MTVTRDEIHLKVGTLEGKVEGIDKRMDSLEKTVIKGFDDVKGLVGDHSDEMRLAIKAVVDVNEKQSERIDQNEKDIDRFKTTARVVKYVSGLAATVLGGFVWWVVTNFDKLLVLLTKTGV